LCIVFCEGTAEYQHCQSRHRVQVCLTVRQLPDKLTFALSFPVCVLWSTQPGHPSIDTVNTSKRGVQTSTPCNAVAPYPIYGLQAGSVN